MDKKVLLSIVILSVVIACQAKTIVNIEEGSLQGKIISSRNGRNISAFIGVPYAEPPIGDLR